MTLISNEHSVSGKLVLTVVIVVTILLMSGSFSIPFSNSSSNHRSKLPSVEISAESKPSVMLPSMLAPSSSVALAPNPAGIGSGSTEDIAAESYLDRQLFRPGPDILLQMNDGGMTMRPSNVPADIAINGYPGSSGVMEVLKADAFVQPLSSYSQYSTVTAAIPGLWLDSSKKRTRSQIYMEILELMKSGPMTPFEIAFYARLNRKRTKDYVEFLKLNGYLNEELEEQTGKKVYVLTKDGFLFLERVKTLFEHNRSSTEIVFSEIAKKSDAESFSNR